MDVVSACPLRVGSLLWQPRVYAFALTVICKATYRLVPIESPLAQYQEDLNKTDTHWAGNEQSSLSAASDIVPFKRKVDVTLVGHAYAPRKQPVSRLVARLMVGALTKSIEVHGDRTITADGQVREGAPFTAMPLWWERAAGGPGTSNPVGIPTGAPLFAARLRALPNLQPPGTTVKSPLDLIPPVGFGPIAPAWPERIAKLRSHGPTWSHRAWAQRPLPDDIDPTFFNAAPPDQQIEHFNDNDRIVLTNLLQDFDQLATKLADVSPRALVQRPGAAEQELKLRCDTLSIDTDRGICTLVWRVAVPLQRPDEQGHIVVMAEAPATKPAIDLGATLIVRGGSSAADTKSALPFAKESSQAIWQETGGADFKQESSATEASASSLDSGETTLLPFTSAALFRDALPFVQPAPVKMSIAGSENGPPSDEPKTLRTKDYEPPHNEAVETERPDFRPPGLPEPPPMLWPLGGLSSAPPIEPEPQPAIAPAQESPEAPADKPPPNTVPAIDLASFSIERFAAIAAEIAEQRAPRAAVLKAHELTEQNWACLDRHFADVLAKESARGSQKLQNASDQAYVAAVESFRGPILDSEYARIVVGMERRQSKETLDALKIQRPALMPILRLWTKRVASNAKLARSVIDQLSHLRTA